jgi:hypothetical protein
MNQPVDIPATPSAALRKLREGLSECGLFVFSAPCKGLCLALGAQPALAQLKREFLLHPARTAAGLLSWLFCSAIPTASFYVEAIRNLL